MKRSLLIVFCLLLFGVPLSAQTAAELDALLTAQTVTVSGAARFVLGAAELLPAGNAGTTAETAAYELALSKGWVRAGAADEITLRDTAFLIMNAFELKGGVMYKLLKNPRYAYRELIYRRLIQGRADPAMKVSGERLLQIIGRTLSYAGERDE